MRRFHVSAMKLRAAEDHDSAEHGAAWFARHSMNSTPASDMHQSMHNAVVRIIVIP